MREIFYARMNNLSGYDPETEENPGQAEHFEQAQKDIQKVRALTEKHYGLALKKHKADCPPLWAFGLVMYQRYVEKGMSLKALLKITSAKHYQKATTIYTEYVADRPQLSPEQIQEIMRKVNK